MKTKTAKLVERAKGWSLENNLSGQRNRYRKPSTDIRSASRLTSERTRLRRQKEEDGNCKAEMLDAQQNGQLDGQELQENWSSSPFNTAVMSQFLGLSHVDVKLANESGS
jgi:hypothetical protein